MIIVSDKAGVFFRTVSELGPMDIGRIITISAPDHESDDEGSTYESSGVLHHLQRKFDSKHNFNGMVIRLSDSQGTVRNRMMFSLDKEEATSGEYKFTLNTMVRH